MWCSWPAVSSFATRGRPRAHLLAPLFVSLLAPLLAGTSLSGCGLLEVGPPSSINQIEPVSIRTRVTELGPLHPERVLFPSDAPVVESLPGDRLRVEIEIVDTDGLALPAEQLDSVWFSLGLSLPVFGTPAKLDEPELDLPCDQLEAWTLDSSCRLGRGRDSIEFEVPPLGEQLWGYPGLEVYAAIAWHGQSAEQCWQARREGRAVAPNCAFVRHSAPLGPNWWLMSYGYSQGLIGLLPVERFPAAVFTQQANRAPKVEAIEIDSEPISIANGSAGPILVQPGERVSLSVIVDPVTQFSQSIFVPLSNEGDLFTLLPEPIRVRVATAGPIRFAGAIATTMPFEVSVDEHAEPGTARVLLVVADDRGGETLVRVELDIQ